MNITERARHAIGENARGDFVLSPSQHADHLPEEATALAKVLHQIELRNFVTQYERADAAAVRAQKLYKFLAGLGTWSVAGALIVATWAVAFPWQRLDGEARQVAIAAIYATIVIGFLSLTLLDRKSPYRAWRQHRGDAEIARGRFFEWILNSPGSGDTGKPGHLPLLPLKVQYLRRYHLDVQCAFFAARSAQAKGAGRRSRLMRLVAFWLISIGFVATAIALAIPFEEPRVMWSIVRRVSRLLEWIDIDYIDHYLLLAGVTVVLLYCLALARSEINRDSRNAYRYERVARRLAVFRDRFRDIEVLALDEDNAAEVMAYFRKLQATLDAEHREWVSLHTMDELETETVSSIRHPGGQTRGA